MKLKQKILLNLLIIKHNISFLLEWIYTQLVVFYYYIKENIYNLLLKLSQKYTKRECIFGGIGFIFLITSILFIILCTNGIEKYEFLEWKYFALESQYEDLSKDNEILYDELEETLESLEVYEEENELLSEELNQIALAEKYRTELINESTYWTAKDLRSGKPRELIKLCAIEYGVDPILAVSISRLETGNWTSDLCVESNNFGGIRTSAGPFASYKTRFEGINAFCKLLKYYNQRGYSTIEEISKLYCPNTAAEWSRKVEEIYEEEK